MKILIVCGVFAKENEAEVIAHAKGGVEFSANLFQQKLIDGFRAADYDTQVLSAPFIGAYPMRSDLIRFTGFREAQSGYRYVSFHNTWGIRNPSRTKALKKEIRAFAEDPDADKLIVVYCPHTPFLEAAVYAKKLDPRIKICLYVPDLPNYMNLSEKRSRIYDFFKKYDIAAMTRLMAQVDSFVLLTEQMKDMLPVGGKPCTVVEGIIPDGIPRACEAVKGASSSVKNIVYTGKMNRKFGIPELLAAFSLLKDPDYRLILCGQGDCDGCVTEAAVRDPRIRQMGQLRPEEVSQLQYSAAVLVNPRPNNEAYTKYSFPSKNIEYLLSGRPVAAYLLDGMPGAYASFLYPIGSRTEDAPKNIAAALEAALSAAEAEQAEKYRLFWEYAKENLMASNVAKAIADMSLKSEER